MEWKGVTPTTWSPSMSLLPSHLFLWSAVGAIGFWRIALKIWKLGGNLGLEVHKNVAKGWRVSILSKMFNLVKVPPSTRVGTCILKRQCLPPQEIGFYLHRPCIGYYRLVQNIFLFATTHKMLDVVKAKPKPMLHIVGVMKFLLQAFVCWIRGAMFVSSDFGIVGCKHGKLDQKNFANILWQMWGPICNVPLRSGMVIL